MKKRADDLRSGGNHRLAGAACLHGLALHPASKKLDRDFHEALRSLRFEHARLDLPARAPRHGTSLPSGLGQSASLPVLPSIKAAMVSPGKGKE